MPSAAFGISRRGIRAADGTTPTRAAASAPELWFDRDISHSQEGPMPTSSLQASLPNLEVTRVASALGAEVRGFDPYKDDAYFERLGIGRTTLEDMAKWAQIIIVCAIPTESAVKILSAELVRSMAKGSIIVIVSRAAVTDFAEIRKRVLADELVLGVDVYDVEPLPVDDPLRNRWNVVHFPHIAGRTFDSGKRFIDLCAEGFRRYFAGEDIPQVVRPGDLPHEPPGWLCE